MEGSIWIIDFAWLKRTSRQTIYTAIEKGKLDSTKKYGTTFIHDNAKSQGWHPKGKKALE